LIQLGHQCEIAQLGSAGTAADHRDVKTSTASLESSVNIQKVFYR